MAVVSNSTAHEVALNMAATGLDRILPLQISCADLEHGKPAPDGYLLAARKLGVSPADRLVVEDSLVDARSGRAACMAVLYHPRFSLSDRAALPAGVVYLPPDGEPGPVIEDFLADPALLRALAP